MKIIRRREDRHRTVAFTVTDCIPGQWNASTIQVLEPDVHPGVGSYSGRELGPVGMMFREEPDPYMNGALYV